MTARIPLCLVSGMIAQLPFGDTLDASVTTGGSVVDSSIITATNPAGTAVTNGQPAYISAAGVMSLAQANNVATTKVVALVQAPSIASGASGAYQTTGVLAAADWTAATGSATLTAGADYFLDPNVAGRLTTTPPSTDGQYLVFIGQAISATELALAIDRPIALGSQTGVVMPEPSFSSVKLLIAPPVGATSVLDYSVPSHALTLDSGAALSSAVGDPWGGTRKVIFMDGTPNAGIHLADHDDFTLTDTFTLEAFVNLTDAFTHAIFVKFNNMVDTSREYALIVKEGMTELYYNPYGIYAPLLSCPCPAPGTWTLITLTRNGSDWKLYHDATEVASTTFSAVAPNTSQAVQIGRYPGSVYSLKGYLGAMRLTSGVARVPSQFMLSSAPPTS